MTPPAPQPRARKRRLRAPLLALAFGCMMVLVLWLLFEGICALLGVDFTHPQDKVLQALEPDPELLYRVKPGHQPIFKTTFNQMGFRGADWEPKAPDTVRVLAIGDSTVFGLDVADHETWPYLLEAALNRSAEGTGRRYQVFNMGRAATSTDTTLADLRRYAPALEPDLIIFGVGYWNDLNYSNEVPGQTDREAIAQGVPQRLIRRGQSPWMRLRLMQLFRRRQWEWVIRDLSRVRREFAASGFYRENPSDSRRRVPLPQFRENLDSLAAWGQEHGVPVLFLQPWMRPEDLPEYPVAQAYWQAVEDAAARHGAPVAPTREAVLEAQARQSPAEPIFLDWVHLTGAGNRVVTETIQKALAEHWRELFPPSPEREAP